MNALVIIQLLATYGPDVAQAAQRIISRVTDPTQEEWDALFERARKSYDDYIREAQTRADSKIRQ